jgi:hypothetical protein
MRKLIFLGFPLLLVLLLSSCMSTTDLPRDTVKLGEQEVNFKADHDVIQVGAYQGSFKALFFVVHLNNIQLYDLVVTYGNGDKEKFDTRLTFDEGTRSRALPLDGGNRQIQQISFTYKTVGDWVDGKARVMVYGIKSWQ